MDLIMVTIDGTDFLFEDENFSLTQRKEFQELANIKMIHPKFENYRDKDMCEAFVEYVFDKFGIRLKPVNISFIVRIYRENIVSSFNRAYNFSE